jgi:glycosyltransferase involved in cell wall biosynthesis
MRLDVSHVILQMPMATTRVSTIDRAADRSPRGDTVVVLAAHNEADRIAATLAALARAFPGAPLWVADDGSTDTTARLAREAGARVVSSARVLGKGAAVTGAAREAWRDAQETSAGSEIESIFVLCDGDLGDSAVELRSLADLVAHERADLAVGAFATRVGGGFGVALAFARWAIRRRCGLETIAPISGQRALRARMLADVLPFASGFGMEIGMTIDAVRAGWQVGEVELQLTHRAGGRTPAGFLHRGRQLVDFIHVYRARRPSRA